MIQTSIKNEVKLNNATERTLTKPSGKTKLGMEEIMNVIEKGITHLNITFLKKRYMDRSNVLCEK